MTERGDLRIVDVPEEERTLRRVELLDVREGGELFGDVRLRLDRGGMPEDDS